MILMLLLPPPRLLTQLASTKPRSRVKRLARSPLSSRPYPQSEKSWSNFSRILPNNLQAPCSMVDIGTVICPDADVKIFVTAAPEVRARRRAREYSVVGRPIDEA